MRTENLVFITLERLWGQTWPMDHRKRVASCRRGNWRLLDEDFQLKPIKRRGKIPFWQFRTISNTLNVFTIQQGVRWLDKTLSQNTTRNRGNDWWQVKDIMKMAEETNMTIMEIEGSILKISINNWVINAINILSISEDL